MYQSIEPYESGHLEVSDGHAVYWEVVGSPGGVPAVWLHGGPGAPASPGSRRNFTPPATGRSSSISEGCGRSRPLASDEGADLSTNTTDHLVADIERLRSHLGIDQWVVVGGSWGVTLGLVYAQRHPGRVLGMVLGAVTAGRWRETQWITRDMGRVFPRQWDRFVGLVPEAERGGDLAAAYARLLARPDRAVREEAARRWCEWETPTCPSRPVTPHLSVRELSWQLAFARLVTTTGDTAASWPTTRCWPPWQGRAHPRHPDSRPLRRFRPTRHRLGTTQGVAGEPPGRRRRRRSFRREHGRAVRRRHRRHGRSTAPRIKTPRAPGSRFAEQRSSRRRAAVPLTSRSPRQPSKRPHADRPYLRARAGSHASGKGHASGGYFARGPRRCLAFCGGQPDQSCLVPTVCPLRVPSPGLLAVYHQRHRVVSHAGSPSLGSAAGASAGRGEDRAGGRDGPAQETAAARVRLFNDLSAKPDIYNPMTAGSRTAGSRMGSQRRQAVTDAGRPTAAIGAGNWLIRRRPATVHDGPIAPEKRKAEDSVRSSAVGRPSAPGRWFLHAAFPQKSHKSGVGAASPQKTHGQDGTFRHMSARLVKWR